MDEQQPPVVDEAELKYLQTLDGERLRFYLYEVRCSRGVATEKALKAALFSLDQKKNI